MEEQQSQLTKQERRALRQQEKLKEQKQREQKRLCHHISLWSIIALVIGGVIFGMIQLTQTPTGTDKNTSVSVRTISNNDWVKGNLESDIVLIEYSDFQCPACGSYYPIVKQISQEFKNDIQFVYRNFPLRQLHPNALIAGQAAEAAGKQGKFWEMHDMIFENQRTWSNQKRKQIEETFISYANTLGIDTEQFKNDLNSKEVRDKVDSDYQSGIKAGVNSTPTFFLNGEKIQNPRNYEEFRNIINQAIDNNS